MIVAQFYNENNTVRQIEERTYDSIAKRLSPESTIQLCLINNVATIVTEAEALGRRSNAAIVIWGRNGEAFEVKVEILPESLSDIDIFELPQSTLEDEQFQFSTPDNIDVVAATTLTRLLMIEGRTDDARILLQDSIESYEDERLGESNPKELASAYFLLATILEDLASTEVDFESAVSAYTRVLALDPNNPNTDAALLNRAGLLNYLGQTDAAIADYMRLIEKNSTLSSGAYINLANIYDEQFQRQIAMEQMAHAVVLDPQGAYPMLHHMLETWNIP
ncbi:MAG: tetratricopeptide repeat protein [bacterium]|nr:tetratricopeptide repeat protein [bacterium]